jgi:nitroreductase
MSIKDLINARYSARIWDKKPVSQEKIDYILHCAYKAPSKQCLYPYEIVAITDSPKGKAFKDELYWNDTWCSDGIRAESPKSKNKRYNGQYKAPLLLCWVNRDPFIRKEEWMEEQAIVDATVSSSFAMLAAEEQGLQTCFGKCHSIEWNNSLFGKEDKKFYIAVGIGYASEVEEDYNDPSLDMLIPVERDGEIDGYDTKNLPQHWSINKHTRRKDTPEYEEIVKYI